MAACPASRERPLVGDRDLRRDFPPVESITIYLMIDLGYSQRAGKVIAVMRWIRGQFSRTAHPEMAPCQVQFAVRSETSKTSRSVVLAVSSSTIKKLSECMVVKVLLLRSSRLYLRAAKVIQPPKRSELKPGLSDGWYQFSSSKFATC